MVWIIRNQFARRNISLYVQEELALKLEGLLKPAIQERAKENQRKSKGARKESPQNSADLKPTETRVELAKVAVVSHDTLVDDRP